MLQFSGIPAANLTNTQDSTQVRIADNALLQDINQLSATLFPQTFRWDSGVTYAIGALVEYQGAIYVATAKNVNVNPTTTSTWTKTILIASSGITIYTGITFSGAVTINGLLTAQATVIKAGTATQAPLTFTAGTNLTSPAAGSMEYDGTDLYFTRVSTRGTISMQRTAGDKTTGSIKYNGTTQAAGQMDGGSTTPSHTNRLNLDGNLFLTNVYPSNPLAIANGGTGNTVMPLLLNDVLLYWPLDDLDKHGTGVVSITPDLSGNAYDGSISGGVTALSPGRAGNAATFDGSSGIVANTNSIFQFTSSFSLSLWVKTTYAGATYVGLLTKFGSTSGWDLGLSPNIPRMALRGTSQIDTGGGSAIAVNDGNWHHVVALCTLSSIQFYIDGTAYPVVSGTWTPTTTTNPMQLGARNSALFFPGSIDEVRVYNRVLSQAEIQYLYNNPAGLTTGMMSGTQIIHSPVFGGYPEWDGQKRVTSQFNKTSDTSLANITGLSVTVAASTSYYFEANLYTSSNASGGVQAAISGTATATAITYDCLTFDAATVKAQTRATSLGTSVGGVTAVTAALMKITGTITVNAGGTLTVQFAQNASNGTASSVLVGSTFIVNQVA